MNSVNLLLLLAFAVLFCATVCFVKPDGKVKELALIGITLWCAAQLFAPILVLR